MTRVVLLDIDSTEITAFMNGITLFHFIKYADVVYVHNDHISFKNY